MRCNAPFLILCFIVSVRAESSALRGIGTDGIHPYDQKKGNSLVPDKPLLIVSRNPWYQTKKEAMSHCSCTGGKCMLKRQIGNLMDCKNKKGGASTTMDCNQDVGSKPYSFECVKDSPLNWGPKVNEPLVTLLEERLKPNKAIFDSEKKALEACEEKSVCEGETKCWPVGKVSTGFSYDCVNQNAEGLPRNEGNFYWSDKFASDRKHRKPLKNYGFVLMDMETKLRPSKAIFNSAKKALKACEEKSACEGETKCWPIGKTSTGFSYDCVRQNAKGLPRNEGNFYWSDKFGRLKRKRQRDKKGKRTKISLKNHGFV
jgi:hypothetical protein